MMPFLRVLFLLLLVTGCAVLLAACAGNAPTFVAPAQRPVANVDKPWPHNHFLTLAYHDVQDANPDQRFLSVRTDLLVAQLEWLHENGYQPVSVDQILAAKRRSEEHTSELQSL